MRRKFLLSLLGCSLIGLVACGAGVSKSVFEDTIWVLGSYGEAGSLNAVLEDTEINIEFVSAEGRMKGSAGCNSYFGSYEVNQDKLTIKSPIGSTMMACPEPVMKQELEYLSALQTAESYKIEDGQLTIICGGRELIFKAQ